MKRIALHWRTRLHFGMHLQCHVVEANQNSPTTEMCCVNVNILLQVLRCINMEELMGEVDRLKNIRLENGDELLVGLEAHNILAKNLI